MFRSIVFNAYVIVVFFCYNYYSVAQQQDAYGVIAGYSLNLHNADFRAFPGVPSCCPKFEKGSGSGMNGGLVYQVPVSNNVRIALRGSYSRLNGTLERTETEVLSGGVQGSFIHQVVANLSDIGFEPLLQYSPVISFWINGGIRASYLATKTFSQKETVQNEGFLFTNGSSSRNEVVNSTLPQPSTLLVGIVAGLSYDVPLNANSTVLLSPEATYVLPFVNIVKDVDWKVSQIRIGASLKWSPLPKKEPLQRKEEKFEIDTVKFTVEPALAGFSKGTEIRNETVNETDNEIVTTTLIHRTDTLRIAKESSLKKKSALSATVSASGLYDDGKETSTLKLEVEEFSSVLMTPLLNYIFFDENSSVIPSRYKRLDEKTRERFREERVNNPDRLQTYYHVLNIIGKRLRLHPEATITLIGCNADIGVEKGNLQLSQKRSEAVKEYLIGTWQIPESRIKIETRNLPVKAANAFAVDGAQENRRVEIVSSMPEITAPLITNDTLKTVTPPSVRFRTNIIHDNEIADWKLSSKQDNAMLKQFDGIGNIPNILDWNVDVEKGTQPVTNSDIVYELNVNDNSGEHVQSKNTIPVEQITIRKKKIEKVADKEVQRFSLILFDVRSTEISSTNRGIIDNIIKPFITERSEISIVGYTDRLGESNQNQQLADGRANATTKALGVSGDKVSVKGVGSASTFNQELPEGRLYTRTVDIIIQTPIK